MEPKKFVEKLIEECPTEKQLADLGFDSLFIKEIVDSYSPIPLQKRSEKQFKEYLDALYYSFDLSNVQIGMITFLPDILETDKFLQFGNIEEQDLIVQDLETSKVLILDYVDQDQVIWECSKNVESFFEACLILARFFTQRLLAENTVNPMPYLREIEMIVGGKSYIPFYEMIIGG